MYGYCGYLKVWTFGFSVHKRCKVILIADIEGKASLLHIHHMQLWEADEADAVSVDNRRGAVLLFLLAFGSPAIHSLHFLHQICHEIVWDWTSLYFNCHHFKSLPCQGVTDSIYSGLGGMQSCEMRSLYRVLILFKTPIHLQINIWGPHISLH